MSNQEDELDDKERKCSHCDSSGIVYQYSNGGDVINMPCPECTDEMSHIRNWNGQMFDG
jgi:hypothetical protein